MSRWLFRCVVIILSLQILSGLAPAMTADAGRCGCVAVYGAVTGMYTRGTLFWTTYYVVIARSGDARLFTCPVGSRAFEGLADSHPATFTCSCAWLY
jgi:hypothetical protein